MNEELEMLFENLYDCFTQRRFADLRNILFEMQPLDIAEFMDEKLDSKEQVLFFRLLPKDVASDVFVEIDSDTKEKLIKEFTDKELKAVIDDMFLDDTVDVIEEMPASIVKRILKNSNPEDRKQINALLNYPDDSAGSIMTPEFVSFSASTTVEKAFDKIRKTGLKKETVYTCYVTDNKKKLIGVVTVKDLLLAEKTEIIENIMETGVIYSETTEDKEQVAMKFSDYDFIALPVIDKEGRIVGIVTVDDAVDVIQEEATEDIQMMAAILPDETPYLKQSVFNIFKARLPWLILLLVTSTFTSLILSGYEQRLSPILYAFVPMLMGTAGNAGGQASVTVIRAIAVGDVEFKDVFRVILKELFTSLCIGTIVGIVCFGKIMLIDKLYYPDITILYAGVISIVCLISIVMAKLVGCMLPLLAKKIKLDPAVVASPLMTTIVDALSLLIFCAISIAIL